MNGGESTCQVSSDNDINNDNDGEREREMEIAEHEGEEIKRKRKRASVAREDSKSGESKATSNVSLSMDDKRMVLKAIDIVEGLSDKVNGEMNKYFDGICKWLFNEPRDSRKHAFDDWHVLN